MVMNLYEGTLITVWHSTLRFYNNKYMFSTLLEVKTPFVQYQKKEKENIYLLL